MSNAGRTGDPHVVRSASPDRDQRLTGAGSGEDGLPYRAVPECNVPPFSDCPDVGGVGAPDRVKRRHHALRIEAVVVGPGVAIEVPDPERIADAGDGMVIADGPDVVGRGAPDPIEG